ncbi:MAG: ABC transporter permease, partial [Lachnospiraceae bacterium]|nr:ABC transporter permease [Lachnospiraceae bacterium]
VFPSDFSPYTKSDSEEEDNLKMTVFSYDDLKNDSAFFEKRYRIIEGNYIDREIQKGVVINFLLAEQNGLKVGDTIELQGADGVLVSAEIRGLFISGSERKQADTTLAVNRVENHIFIDNSTYSEIYPDDGYYKAAVYARNPEELKRLEADLSSIFSDKVVMTTSDTLFQQMKAPLDQIIRVVRLMLNLTFVTGAVVITILLCMWMRTRKKDMAIFISIGKSKVSILQQVLLEAFGVFLVSVAGACAAGNLIAKLLENLLINSRTEDVNINVSLKLPDIVSLMGIGSLIVLIAVIFSILPILRANPKDTLSKMEG